MRRKVPTTDDDGVIVDGLHMILAVLVLIGLAMA